MAAIGPTYDATEATALLRGLRAELHLHDFYEDREAAIWPLLESVIKAAEDAGYDASKEHGFLHVTLRKSGSVAFRVEDDKLRMFNPGPPRQEVALKIEYDGAQKKFVGLEVDEEHVPVPGELIGKRRDAVTVVVEAIVATIRVQHEARKNAR